MVQDPSLAGLTVKFLPQPYGTLLTEFFREWPAGYLLIGR